MRLGHGTGVLKHVAPEHVATRLYLAKGRAFRDFLLFNMHALTSSLYLHSHHSCASSRFLFNPSLRSRIQVLEILSLITLLSSNLGTKSYVLRFLWNLHLSNSCLFSSGYTISPRFLSPRAHAKSRSHVHREPRHVPIPPVIPGGEYSLTPGTIPH